jgi:hypothetical protein
MQPFMTKLEFPIVAVAVVPNEMAKTHLRRCKKASVVMVATVQEILIVRAFKNID